MKHAQEDGCWKLPLLRQAEDWPLGNHLDLRGLARFLLDELELVFITWEWESASVKPSQSHVTLRASLFLPVCPRLPEHVQDHLRVTIYWLLGSELIMLIVNQTSSKPSYWFASSDGTRATNHA